MADFTCCRDGCGSPPAHDSRALRPSWAAPPYCAHGPRAGWPLRSARVGLAHPRDSPPSTGADPPLHPGVLSPSPPAAGGLRDAETSPPFCPQAQLQRVPCERGAFGAGRHVPCHSRQPQSPALERLRRSPRRGRPLGGTAGRQAYAPRDAGRAGALERRERAPASLTARMQPCGIQFWSSEQTNIASRFVDVKPCAESSSGRRNRPQLSGV